MGPLPFDSRTQDNRKAPLRDRVRGATIRLYDALVGWAKARSIRESADGAKATVEAIVTGGIPIAVGTWIAYKLSVTFTTSDSLMRTSFIILPPLPLPEGRAWLADEIGLVFGPLLAAFMPQNMSYNIIEMVRNRGYSTRAFPNTDIPRITQEISQENWWEAYWVPTPNVPNHSILYYKVHPVARILIAGLAIGWSFGLANTIVEIIKKVIP